MSRVGAFRNRLARWMREASYRLEWYEPECHFVTASGRVCGLIRDVGEHGPASQCPAGAECRDAAEHHRFVR